MVYIKHFLPKGPSAVLFHQLKKKKATEGFKYATYRSHSLIFPKSNIIKAGY